MPKETVVIDMAERELIPFKYSITSYGADYPVDSLVQRLDRDVVVVPAFQRKYVWTLPQASRFIESLLLGLPVPGIFLSKESETSKLLIIDGQQRLRTLGFFYAGVFRRREFALRDVQPEYEGKTYKTLNDEDRTRLDDSIIHATIVRQDHPSEDQSSIYHVFQRLNTGGTNLQPQEIRACIFHGDFERLLKSLDENENWRNVYGPPSPRMKDQELILRFLALFLARDSYERPMSEFLNKFMGANRYLKQIPEERIRGVFEITIAFIARTLGKRAFRPERGLNAAVLDAVMVATARLLETNSQPDPDLFERQYLLLLENKDFISTIKAGTSDEAVVGKRLRLAYEVLVGQEQ